MSIVSAAAMVRCFGKAIQLCYQLHFTLWKVKRQLRPFQKQPKFQIAKQILGELTHRSLLSADQRILVAAYRHRNIRTIAHKHCRLERMQEMLKNLPVTEYFITTPAAHTVARGAIAALAKKFELKGIAFISAHDPKLTSCLRSQLIHFIDLQLCRIRKHEQLDHDKQRLLSERMSYATQLDLQSIQSEYEIQALRYFALPQSLLAALASTGCSA